MACSRGSRKKSSAPDYGIVSAKDSVCALYGAGSIMCQYASGGIGPILPNAVVDVNSFCSAPANPPDSLNITDFLGVGWVEVVIQLAEAQKWPEWCECIPDPDAPPSHSGGQCPGIIYIVKTRGLWRADQQWYYYNYRHTGPIGGMYLGPHSSGGNGFGWNYGSPAKFSDTYAHETPVVSGGTIIQYLEAEILSVEREDGQPDNCGDPQPTGEQPDPIPPPPAPPPGLPTPPPSPYTGPAGSDGPAGSQGQVGPAGPSGQQGPTGPAGSQGQDGAQGPQGLQGLPGQQGETGLQGVSGAQGLQGSPGLQGEPGPQGLQGEVGPQGLQGEPGETEQLEIVDVQVTVGECVDYEFTEYQLSIPCFSGLEFQTKQHFAELLEIKRLQCADPDYSVGEPLTSYTQSVYPCCVLYFNDVRTSKLGVGRYLQIPAPDLDAVLAWANKDHIYNSGHWMSYIQYFNSKGVRIQAYGLTAEESVRWRNIMHSLSTFGDAEVFHVGPPRETVEKLEYNLYLKRITYFEDNSFKKSGRQTGKLIWEAR